MLQNIEKPERCESDEQSEPDVVGRNEADGDRGPGNFIENEFPCVGIEEVAGGGGFRHDAEDDGGNGKNRAEDDDHWPREDEGRESR